jgi:hypothetical protein
MASRSSWTGSAPLRRKAGSPIPRRCGKPQPWESSLSAALRKRKTARRSSPAAVGLTGSAGRVAFVSAMLTQIPDPVSPTGPSVDQRLTAARALFDAGQHQDLPAAVPDLFTHAHQAARSHRELGQARLSASYALSAGVLGKMGHYDQARTAADRAVVYAEVSGSALAGAAAARELSIVLRHHGEDLAAQRISGSALARVEATGLLTGAQQAAVPPDALHHRLHPRPRR